MSDRITKKELVERVSTRFSKKAGTVEEIVDATFEEIYQDTGGEIGGE